MKWGRKTKKVVESTVEIKGIQMKVTTTFKIINHKEFDNHLLDLSKVVIKQANRRFVKDLHLDNFQAFAKECFDGNYKDIKDTDYLKDILTELIDDAMDDGIKQQFIITSAKYMLDNMED